MEVMRVFWQMSSLTSKIKSFAFGFRESFLLYRSVYIFLLAILISSILAIRFFTGQLPVIQIEVPNENAVVESDKIYIKGKVTPKVSNITVNDDKVFLNGDGSFTYIMPIKVGTNIIRVKATRFSYTSEVARLIERKDSEDNLAKKQDKEDEMVNKFDLLNHQNSKITDNVSGAKVTDGSSGIVITKQQLLPDYNSVRILGEVANQTGEEVSDVKITSIFYNPNNEVVDIKSNYITSPDLKLAVGQAAPFEIQSSLQPTDFSSYKFEVAWQ